MPIQFSPLLIVALLLSSFVIAQYIGLRPVKNLNEVFGIGLCSAGALIIAALIDWPLTRFILQPLGLAFLHNLIAILLIAVSAQVVELVLRNRHPNYFPRHGNFLPLIIINGLILAQPLLHNALDIDFIAYVLRAALFGIGAASLLAAFQILRAQIACAELPAAFRGAAIDMLSAGLIVAACSGIAGIF